MKTLNEIYDELRAEADNEDCEQSLWDMAKKIFDDYCKKNWSGANNELEYQFIKNNIENNDYYEIPKILPLYDMLQHRCSPQRPECAAR